MYVLGKNSRTEPKGEAAFNVLKTVFRYKIQNYMQILNEDNQKVISV